MATVVNVCHFRNEGARNCHTVFRVQSRRPYFGIGLRAAHSSGAQHGGRKIILYSLTSICLAKYINCVESVFEVIAEPNRRAILNLLVSAQQSVGEIERQLRMPQPAVSKHLRVLREAGFVESTIDAQRRLYRLKPEPLQEVDAWLAPFRRFWSAHLDALERHLDRMEQSTSAKATTSSKRGSSRERKKGETR
jgi:DNA-binding transcriptional ArsR family regulator